MKKMSVFCNSSQRSIPFQSDPNKCYIVHVLSNRGTFHEYYELRSQPFRPFVTTFASDVNVIVIPWFIRLYVEIIHDFKHTPYRLTIQGIINLYHIHQCRPCI